MSSEASLDWTRAVPEREVDVSELEYDEYGFFKEKGQPFDGIAVSYYPNGQIESRRPCLNGMPHGECRWWHENGQLSEEWLSYRGMGHCWATKWYENGAVASRRYAEFGRPLEWTEFDKDGRQTSSGSKRQDEHTMRWIQRYRAAMPDAP